MDEKKSAKPPLSEGEAANTKNTFDLGSPERVQVDELLSILNVLIRHAASGQDRSVADGVMNILMGSKSVGPQSIPQEIKSRIRSRYQTVRDSSNSNPSDLIIEGDFLEGLRELGSKVDATGGYEDGLRRLIGYSRGFVGTRLQAATVPPDARLRGDLEALVASSPLPNLAGYFKRKWDSGPIRVLDLSDEREGLSAYLRECEAERVRQEDENARQLLEAEEARARILEAHRLAQGRQAVRPSAPRALARKEVATDPVAPAKPDEEATVKGGKALAEPLRETLVVEKLSTEPTPVRADRGLAPEPSRVKTLVEEAPVELSKRKTFVDPPRVKTIVDEAPVGPPEEKTVVRQMEYDFGYDKPLEGLNLPNLAVDDVIYCETANHSVYEFKVFAKEDKFVELIGVNGRYAGNRLYIHEDQAFVLGGSIKFTNDDLPIKDISKLEVRKKETLSKNDRKVGNATIIRTSVPEKNELEERNSEVAAIGDSNGNFKAYKSNLEKAEVIEIIDEDYEDDRRWIAGPWKAKSREAVILGDIVADRNPEGFRIMDDIRRLTAEAKNVHGDITVIAGNHEEYMLAIMLGRRIKAPKEVADKDGRVDPFGQCLISNQGLGIFELTQFTGDKKMIVDVNWMRALADEGMQDKLRKRLTDALPAMHKDQRGQRLLEQMCQMKLCKQIGNTIFMHTDPTNEILETILDKKWGVEKINKRFEEILRKGLIRRESFDPRDHYLFDTFLYTENRTFANYVNPPFDKETGLYMKNRAFTDFIVARNETGERETFSEYVDFVEKIGEGQWGLNRDLVRRLKNEKGVRQIVFGHSNLGKGNRKPELEGITFVNADQGAGKREGKPINTASVAIIDTRGKVEARTGTAVMARSEIEKNKK